MQGLRDAAIRAAREAALARADLVVRLRRDLHGIPEPAYGEHETTRYVQAFLQDRGIPFRRLRCGTGGVAVVGRGERGVLLRADLDALPVEEETGLPYRSRRPGFMHACGHDAHTAMLLAAADALAAGDVVPDGRVVLLFQPAEEGHGGAAAVLEEGILEAFPAAAAVALHVWTGFSTGTVGISQGPIMASMDRLRLVFRGQGGHGAFPHACVDPVVMAAEGVLSFQTLVSRKVDPAEPAVLTVGAVRGGSAANVIPESVELLATVRAFDPAVRQEILAGIRRLGDAIAEGHGGRFSMDLEEHYPVTRNDPAATARVRDAAAAVLGARAVRPAQRTMGAEDMGLILARIPGCYVQLGAVKDPSSAQPLHSPRFVLDEDCLPVGVMVLLASAVALATSA